MSYQSVRLLIEDVAKSLADNIQFSSGRHSEFNIIPNKSYPWIWMLPITANPRFAVNDVEHYLKAWNINLLFLDKDAFDAPQGPSNDILDVQDNTVDRFLLRLNEWSRVASQDIVGDVTITGISQQPFYKDDSGIHTGWLLTFVMTVPDDFLYCRPENVYVDATTN